MTVYTKDSDILESMSANERLAFEHKLCDRILILSWQLMQQKPGRREQGFQKLLSQLEEAEKLNHEDFQYSMTFHNRHLVIYRDNNRLRMVMEFLPIWDLLELNCEFREMLRGIESLMRLRRNQ